MFFSSPLKRESTDKRNTSSLERKVHSLLCKNKLWLRYPSTIVLLRTHLSEKQMEMNVLVSDRCSRLPLPLGIDVAVDYP